MWLQAIASHLVVLVREASHRENHENIANLIVAKGLFTNDISNF